MRRKFREVKKLGIITILIIASFVVCGCSKEEVSISLTEEEKVEDFEYLFKTIEENYPFLDINKRVNGIDWIENKDKYLEMVKATKSDYEFLNTLSYILAQLRNGHTHMVQTSEQFKGFRYVYSRTNNWTKMQMKVLNDSKALARYNIDKDEDKKALETTNKEELIAKINASANDIVEDKVGYIYIPEMIAPYELEKDKELLSEYLYKIKDYQALIIDIRGNGGGNSSYWSDFLLPKIIDKRYVANAYIFWKDGDYIKRFIRKSWKWIDSDFGMVKNLDTTSLLNLPEEVKRDFKYYWKSEISVSPKNSINFKGNIYLLVDKYVYSSSEMLSSFAKQSGCAILIGERTGGDGIGSDPLLAVLPNSGYIFRFSKDMGVVQDGTANEEFKTEPDYEIELPMKHRDFKKDNCIKKVLELEEIEDY